MFVKPRFSSFYYFKHVRLLDFSFYVNVFLLFGLGFEGAYAYACAHILEVCIHIQLGCACRPYVSARRPYVSAHIFVHKNPNPTLFASIYLFYMLLS